MERPEIETYLQPRISAAADDGVCHGSFPAASISLEWSVDDFAISQFASALGDSATASGIPGPGTVLAEPVQSHHRLHLAAQRGSASFPTGPGVVHARVRCFSQDGFDEGNAEQYVWYVPQNIAGLVTALGGRQAVAERLDKFTSELNVGPVGPVSVGR